MTQETKEKLLEVGIESIRTGGYSGVSIKDIVSVAGVPKGSFHYYFDNKESFGVEAMDFFAVRMRALFEPIVNDDSLSSLNKLRKVFEVYSDCLDSENCKSGCLVGMMAMEVADVSEELRLKAQAGMSEFQALLKLLLSHAQQAGEVNPDLDAQLISAFMVNGWQGAILRMKAEKSQKPLKDFETVVFNQLLN